MSLLAKRLDNYTANDPSTPWVIWINRIGWAPIAEIDNNFLADNNVSISRI
jgi:hypothetical protein